MKEVIQKMKQATKCPYCGKPLSLDKQGCSCGAYRVNEDNYDLTKLSEERKIEIIRKAISKISLEDMFKAEELYELRFDKQNESGYEPIWNQAAHLVTTHLNYKTDKTNFNFIFSDNDSKMKQWNYIYSTLPYLLYYTVEVVEAIINNFAEYKNKDLDLTNIRRIFGLLLWLDEYNLDYGLNTKETMKYLNRKLIFPCLACNKNIKFGVRNLKMLYQKNEVKCFSCKGVCNFDELQDKEIIKFTTAD
ncbi:hypothetical protein LCGC14_2297530 [marine sediment metagenome]|uniref:Uncharacterized protein n=1 Tax=marine sediment metagenome TaxID=412755 RepID=A0A0F9FJG6_9ZZZZ